MLAVTSDRCLEEGTCDIRCRIVASSKLKVWNITAYYEFFLNMFLRFDFVLLIRYGTIPCKFCFTLSSRFFFAW